METHAQARARPRTGNFQQESRETGRFHSNVSREASFKKAGEISKQ